MPKTITVCLLILNLFSVYLEVEEVKEEALHAVAAPLKVQHPLCLPAWPLPRVSLLSNGALQAQPLHALVMY